MKYDVVDKEKANKFINILKKLKRHKSEHRRECQKEIFIRRTLKKNLLKKYFTFINKEGIGIFDIEGNLFSGLGLNIVNPENEIKVPMKRYVRIAGVRYCLGYGEEIEVYVDFAHSLKRASLTFRVEDFFKLEFKEISKEEYDKVSSNFVDDRE